MKSKKLIAILTLVVFMMTLLPMAAFAAGAANRYASFIQTDKTTVVADGEEKVKVEVYLYDTNNDPADTGLTPYVYVATYRAGTDKLYASSDLSAESQITAAGVLADEGENVYAITNSSGKATFYVASTVAGTTKIAAGLTNGSAIEGSVYEYLVGGADATAAKVQLVGNVADITFTAGSANTVKAVAIADNVTGPDFNLSAGTGSDVHISSATGVFAQGNGSSYYELSFKVMSSGGSPVKDSEVKFSVSDPALSLNKTTGTTDSAGIVKVKVTATKAFTGTDYVKATSGDKSGKAYVKFDGNAPFKIELVGGGNETVAKGKDYEIKFKLTDLNGNQIKLTSTAEVNPADTAIKEKITFEATTKPTDVKLPEKISEAVTSYAKVKGNSAGNYILKLTNNALDKEGDYVIKAYLSNGAYVNVPFKVKKQGDVVKMTLEYDSTTVAKGGSTSGATIRYYDAENIMEKVTAHSNVVFSVSPAPVAAAITPGTGEILTTTDKDYKGNFVVTAVDFDKDLAATATLMMTKDVSTVKVEDAPAAKPGTASKITIQLYDMDGVKTAFGTGVAVELNKKVVTGKPSDAIVTVSAAADFASDLKETGKSTIDIKSTHAGTVVVDAVIKAGDNFYPVQITTKFEEAPAPVVGAAASVTMFIGATGFVQDGVAKVTDVAPFIQDGRTFVAVRPLGDAFGAAIGWNEATQTVTLTRSDMTVTIVIGSSAITVVKGGVTTTVTADVPAMIKNGRTVLPFRAVGEAFGYKVGYDAATQAVSYSF